MKTQLRKLLSPLAASFLVLLLWGGALVAQTFDFFLFVGPGNNNLTQGDLLFSGTISLTNVTVDGTYNFYTSASSASGSSYGVLTSSSFNASGCINDFPDAICFNQGTNHPNVQTGTINGGSLVAGTFTNTGGVYTINTLSFGAVNNSGYIYVIENVGPTTYDVHAASIASGSGDTTLFNYDNATPQISALLPEINGGALAKGLLLMSSLLLLIGARRKERASAR